MILWHNYFLWGYKPWIFWHNIQMIWDCWHHILGRLHHTWFQHHIRNQIHKHCVTRKKKKINIKHYKVTNTVTNLLFCTHSSPQLFQFILSDTNRCCIKKKNLKTQSGTAIFILLDYICVHHHTQYCADTGFSIFYYQYIHCSGNVQFI